jgi:uncharacterized tellurite resistance protein B-like protein
MELPTGTGESTADAGDVTAIRITLHQLAALDPQTAGYLNALAFVLVRVADIDQHITIEERRRMEEILVNRAHLTHAQAVLVVEIARHRTRLADCGCSYGESRLLRDRLDSDQRDHVLDSLYAVAAADGRTTRVERDEIFQIASELGFRRHDLEPIRDR